MSRFDMCGVAGVAVSVRRMLAKRPWIYWVVVALAAAGAATTMVARSGRVDTAREAWGDTRSVWVATAELQPGDELAVEYRDVPLALIAPGAVADIEGLVARQHIAVGEIVDDIDVVALTGPQAMTPTGWLAVPVRESPPSGAAVGDRVSVATDGIVISADAIVVGHHDDATLVAVPSAEAPVVAGGAGERGVTLLLVP